MIAELRPSYLAHLAWMVEPGKFWTAPENSNWLEASADLLSLFAAWGGKRALLAGTCAEYDWRLDLGRPWREDDPCAPQTPYGQAKHELHLRAAEIAAQSGLSLVWARLFMIFGPHEDQRRLVPSICRPSDIEVRLQPGTHLRHLSGAKVMRESEQERERHALSSQQPADDALKHCRYHESTRNRCGIHIGILRALYGQQLFDDKVPDH